MNNFDRLKKYYTKVKNSDTKNYEHYASKVMKIYLYAEFAGI